jgi:hypothetical protein
VPYATTVEAVVHSAVLVLCVRPSWGAPGLAWGWGAALTLVAGPLFWPALALVWAGWSAPLWWAHTAVLYSYY